MSWLQTEWQEAQAWSRRIAWTVPAAFGVMGSILLQLGQGWGMVALALALVLAALTTRPMLVALTLLLSGLGFLSSQTVNTRPDPLQQWIGAQVTLTGQWDGQFLTLQDPKSRLAVAPKPKAGPGKLVVSGRLVLPESQRTPGGFNQAAWLKSQGGLFLPTPSMVLVAAKVRQQQPERGLKGWFRTGLKAGLNERQAALMQAIELGDRGDIGREEFVDGYSVRDAFTRSGLAHLMALSGQNVALITVVLIWLLGRTPLPLAWRYGIPAALLIPYLFVLVNVSPSITRAVIMGIAALLGLMVGRGKLEPYGLLGLSALISLLLFPMWLLDIGFQLSFLAVLALTLSAKAAQLLPQRWPMALKMALSATILAELGTLPIIASTFGQLPVVGLPANLLAEIIMALLVPLGFLAGLLGPLAAPINLINGLLAELLLAVVQFFGQAPVLSWGSVSTGGFMAYGLSALAAVLWLLGQIRSPVALATGLVCMMFTAFPPVLKPKSDLVFLDVGQGDSTLIRLPKLTMLIDAGGSVGSDYDVGGRTVVPALRALGIRKIDVVVATHADTDHIEGISGVLKALPVGELWIGQRKIGDPVLDPVLALAKQRGVPIREVKRGDQIKASDATLTVLWPKGNVWSTADNDNSVAIKLERHGWKTAFLGDLPDPAEGYLGIGQLDLLKAAHHGSHFSSSAEFLRQTSPKDMLISVGRNTYGHPHKDVLARLKQAGIKAWRTDQLGTVYWPLP